MVLLAIGLWRRRTARGQHMQGEADSMPAVVPSDQPGALPGAPTAWVVGGGIIMPVIVLTLTYGLTLAAMRAQANQKAEEVVIEVIGRQWWWEVRYPADNVITANEIHIPAGQPVALQLTSADVIHSFWVPELNGKLDLNPNQTNTLILQADQPGEYRGQCAEFCGIQHAKMALLVIAHEPAEYAAWISAQQQDAAAPADEAAEFGQQVLLGSACVYCHTIRGTNASGVLGPDLTHLASRRTLAAATIPNTRGHLAGWIVDPQGIKPGNQMPPTDLGADELQALLAYLESLR
jgi:cytochrome c oxidase subunit 2